MRRSKVVGFSIPPELHKKFDHALRSTHKNKSEFFREVLDAYFETSKLRGREGDEVRETDAAKALQAYWNFRKSTKSKVLIVGAAIIERNGTVLIGQRKKKDKWVEYLNWTFPGGRMESLDFESEITREVKEETGLDVSLENLVASRIHPDSGFKDVQIVVLYFHCKTNDKKEAKPLQEFKEFKWVKPQEVFTYFSTSVGDEVAKFLAMLQKAK